MTSATSATTALRAPPATTPGNPLQRIDPRWYSSSLLTVILVIGHWKFHILGDSYMPWLVALGTAIGTEIVLFRFLRGGAPNLLSAYISGNSVAFLVKPDGALIWPFVMGALLSITSKYVLNFEKRHLWNPTNFGVCLLLALASHRVSILGHQWGNHLGMVAIIWAIGLLTVWRARVLHITLAYLASFVLFAGVRSAITGQPLGGEVAPVTGPMYQLFMFFMVTDPRTLVSGKRKQLLVVFLVAAAECAIRLAADMDVLSASNPMRTAPPMFALFLVGPAALFLELYEKRRAAMAARPS